MTKALVVLGLLAGYSFVVYGYGLVSGAGVTYKQTIWPGALASATSTQSQQPTSANAVAPKSPDTAYSSPIGPGLTPATKGA